MTQVFTEGKRPGDWLKGETETPKDFSRERITVLAGEDLVSGQVLGKITASGKYAGFDQDATDGSQNAAGLLYLDVGADTSGDVDAVAIVRDARVSDNGITWPGDITDNEKAAGVAQLLALGIIVTEGA